MAEIKKIPSVIFELVMRYFVLNSTDIHLLKKSVIWENKLMAKLIRSTENFTGTSTDPGDWDLSWDKDSSLYF